MRRTVVGLLGASLVCAGPLYGVKLPAVGVKIRVLSADGDTMRIRIS